MPQPSPGHGKSQTRPCGSEGERESAVSQCSRTQGLKDESGERPEESRCPSPTPHPAGPALPTPAQAGLQSPERRPVVTGDRRQPALGTFNRCPIIAPEALCEPASLHLQKRGQAGHPAARGRGQLTAAPPQLLPPLLPILPTGTAVLSGHHSTQTHQSLCQERGRSWVPKPSEAGSAG